jgi:hypothetical protein
VHANGGSFIMVQPPQHTAATAAAAATTAATCGCGCCGFVAVQLQVLSACDCDAAAGYFDHIHSANVDLCTTKHAKAHVRKALAGSQPASKVCTTGSQSQLLFACKYMLQLALALAL